MPRDSTVIAFRQPEAIDDPLTEVAREAPVVLPSALVVRVVPRPTAGLFSCRWRKQKVDATQIQNRRDSTPGHEHALPSRMCGPFKVSSGGVGASPAFKIA
jgi:hypothetical protein